MQNRLVVTFIGSILAASVAIMVDAAGRDDRIVTAAGAWAFAAAIVICAIWINARAWRHAAQKFDDTGARMLLRDNTLLLALLYSWGSAALIAVYCMTDLTWRHWWQYGLAMGLIAAGLFVYARHIGTNAEAKIAPPWLSLLHGAAAAGGLVFLVRTGKLATLKRDWAANDVFLFGGWAIVALSIIAAITQRRLRKARRLSLAPQR